MDLLGEGERFASKGMDVVDLRGCSQVANDLGALKVAIVSGWFHEIEFY